MEMKHELHARDQEITSKSLLNKIKLNRLRAGIGAANLLVAVLLSVPAVMQAQTNGFSIRTNSFAMSAAFNGENFLVGLEQPGTPHTIAAQLISTNGARIGPPIPTGRTGKASAVAFDGTNCLLIWEDNAQGTLTNESYQVCGLFINKAGAAIRGPFSISGLGVQFDGIRTMAFGGGKYLVTYTRLIDPLKGDRSEPV